MFMIEAAAAGVVPGASSVAITILPREYFRVVYPNS